MKAVIKMISVGFAFIFSMCMFSCNTAMAKNYTVINAEIPVFCSEMCEQKKYVYNIMISPENDISPCPKRNMLSIKENESGKFEIDISEPGTFLYKVFEQQGTDRNIKYDTTVYYVTVCAFNDSHDGLTCSVSASAVGIRGKSDKLEFYNTVKTDIPDITPETSEISYPPEISEPSLPDSPPEISEPSVPDYPPERSEPSVPESSISEQSVSEGSEIMIDYRSKIMTGMMRRVTELMRTGDNEPLFMLAGMTVCSGGIILILIIRKKRSDEEKEEKQHDEM